MSATMNKRHRCVNRIIKALAGLTEESWRRVLFMVAEEMGGKK